MIKYNTEKELTEAGYSWLQGTALFVKKQQGKFSATCRCKQCGFYSEPILTELVPGALVRIKCDNCESTSSVMVKGVQEIIREVVGVKR
jgi:Zn finger protein HypA/HybF involved in hydrogenase expression